MRNQLVAKDSTVAVASRAERDWPPVVYPRLLSGGERTWLYCFRHSRGRLTASRGLDHGKFQSLIIAMKEALEAATQRVR